MTLPNALNYLQFKGAWLCKVYLKKLRRASRETSRMMGGGSAADDEVAERLRRHNLWRIGLAVFNLVITVIFMVMGAEDGVSYVGAGSTYMRYGVYDEYI